MVPCAGEQRGAIKDWRAQGQRVAASQPGLGRRLAQGAQLQGVSVALRRGQHGVKAAVVLGAALRGLPA